MARGDCAGAFGNGKPHRSSMTGSVVIGAKWLELTEQDIEPATGYIAQYLIGYDAQQKSLVEFDANNCQRGHLRPARTVGKTTCSR